MMNKEVGEALESMYCYIGNVKEQSVRDGLVAQLNVIAEKLEGAPVCAHRIVGCGLFDLMGDCGGCQYFEPGSVLEVRGTRCNR